MSKLPLCTYGELAKIAESLGYRWVRRKGSHNTFRNSEGGVVVIPDHGSTEIVRPLLRKILRDLSLSPEDYVRLLEER